MKVLQQRPFVIVTITAMLLLSGLVMSGETHAQRFVDNGDGTVTDTLTSLMWTKHANPFGPISWSEAMSMCSSFNISGVGGWRLPSKDELLFLYQAMQGGHPFTGIHPSNYWSSTISPDKLDGPWFVSMQSGSVDMDIKSNSHLVWPVRASQ